jgi:protein phosphatase
MTATTDWRAQRGPFDIIGDVHGCAEELQELLAQLGYAVRLEGAGDARHAVTSAPAGRRAFFVGDLVDRGPNSPDVLRIVMDMVAQGHALAVAGNHDDKFLRWLKGRNVKIAHGLEGTISQLDGEGGEVRARARTFLDPLPSHAWLDDGKLAIAHAGIREKMIGRDGPRVRDFGLYGDSDSRPGGDGLPQRYDWSADYSGRIPVVYGHTPVETPEWVSNTLCIDTGCVYGGKLTALRWPEREIVSVPAKQAYAELKREFGLPPPRPPGQAGR